MKYYYPILVVAALAASCKKDDNKPSSTPATTPATTQPKVTTALLPGLSSDPSKIEGYMYASYSRDVSYNSGFNLSMFSAFGSPARNLFANYDHQNDRPLIPGIADYRGNIDLGDVTFSGNSVFKSASPTNSSYFTSAALSSTNSAAKWKTVGNSNFVALDLTIDRGFPAVVHPPVNGININSGFAVKVSDYVANYDSVTFKLAGNAVAPYGFSIEKTVAAAVDSIKFTTEELATAYPTYHSLYFTIKAYNYSNKTVSDKKYIFELSSKAYNKPMYLAP